MKHDNDARRHNIEPDGSEPNGLEPNGLGWDGLGPAATESGYLEQSFPDTLDGGFHRASQNVPPLDDFVDQSCDSVVITSRQSRPSTFVIQSEPQVDIDDTGNNKFVSYLRRKRSGKNLLASLEDMVAKKAPQKRAACLARDGWMSTTNAEIRGENESELSDGNKANAEKSQNDHFEFEISVLP